VSDEYAPLAPFYESLEMARFAESFTPALVSYAQSHDWVGRRAVDLGCGTGASVRWFANHGYNITGIDVSPAMLAVAQQSLGSMGMSFQLFEGDIRTLSNLHDIEMALALDVLNELHSLRDLEAVFTSVARILSNDCLFIFDLHTIGGLARQDQTTSMLSNGADLTVLMTNHFDYERQASTDDYLIFQRSGSAWQRQHAQRTLRGFPVQVVSALLQRSGFGIMALLNVRLESVDPATTREPRVIFFARRAKPGTE
jgi:ubiquinone/menaquinone biosynthesis C-methylase UbiE